MKKILCLVCVATLGLVACSENRRDSAIDYDGAYDTSAMDLNGQDAKYQIIDQEFDNLLAPETDYDTVPAYELQACGDSYLPLIEPDCCGKGKAAAAAKGKAKAQATAKSVSTTRAKRVTNTTNIYYVDGPNPSVPVSSTTTTKTVYTNGKVSSSSTTSSNVKTTHNADGSVTTTTINY